MRTCRRMTVHESDGRLNDRFAYDRVRIQQQHIFALALAEGNVVATCETQVMRTGDDMDSRETAAEICHRSVMRMVVNHKHFGLHAFQSTEQTLQTLPKIILDIVVYDDNTQLHLSSSSGLSK